MKEKDVRRVMIKYFESKNVDVVPQSGAGPDLHIKGRGVVEVKGTKYDFSRLVKQLVDYARKCPEVALALPFDGLDLEKIQQLTEIERLVEQIFRSVLKLYVVIPDNNVFYVKDYRTLGEARADMVVSIVRAMDWTNPLTTLDRAVQDIIDYSPTALLKRNILRIKDLYTTQIVI